MKKNWQKKEIKDVEDFNGKLQKASGRIWNKPGDVIADKFFIDSKYSKKSSYSISIKTWNKLCEEAAFEGIKIPLLSCQIQNTELIVISKEDFLRLIKEDQP